MAHPRQRENFNFENGPYAVAAWLGATTTLTGRDDLGQGGFSSSTQWRYGAPAAVFDQFFKVEPSECIKLGNGLTIDELNRIIFYGFFAQGATIANVQAGIEIQRFGTTTTRVDVPLGTISAFNNGGPSLFAVDVALPHDFGTQTPETALLTHNLRWQFYLDDPGEIGVSVSMMAVMAPPLVPTFTNRGAVVGPPVLGPKGTK